MIRCRKAYFKLIQAGIREDMAKRVMYSIVPAVSSPVEVMNTGGVVNYQALKAAVEGRKNLIHYGSKAVVGELKHYKSDKIQYFSVLRKLEAGKLLDAVEDAIRAYSDYSNWGPAYGGKAWESIAKCVKQLIVLDQSLQKIRQLDKTPENQQREIDIMKDIIVEMNLFDGLSHNTGPILDSVIEKEHYEMPEDESALENNYQQLVQRKEKIRNIMNAKELQSPVEVYKHIEDALKDSGSTLPFKDQVSKIRSNPEYHKSNPLVGYEMFLIDIRKALIDRRSLVNEVLDELRKNKEEDDVDGFVHEFRRIHANFHGFVSYVLDYYANESIKKYPFPESIDKIKQFEQKFGVVVSNIIREIRHQSEPHVTIDIKRPDNKTKEEAKNIRLAYYDKAISLVSRLIFLLDSV